MTVISAEELMNLMKELNVEEIRGAEIEGDIELEIESSVFVQQIAPQITEATKAELSSAIQNLSNILKLFNQ